MSVNEERLRNILSYVATKNRMNNWTYKRREINEKIENYFGFLIPVTVVGVCEDSYNELAEQVFLKLPSLDESVRSFSGYLWDTEVYVYENLVPIFKRLSNINKDELIPRCYYADSTPNNQVLVLDDVRGKGFHKYTERFLDFEHIMISLKALAQFHAFSILMKNKGISLDAYVLRPYTHTFPVELNIILQNSLRFHSQLFKGSKYVEFFSSLLTDYETILRESTTNVKCLVYGHGDYWKENIMYKYEKNKPIKACMLDFQCCRVMSPAHDFLYFILNCSNATTRKLHYKHFLTEYYDSLKKILKDYAVDIEKFYSIGDFTSDLRVVAPLCLIRICMAFSLWLGFETDSVVKSKPSSIHDKDSGEYIKKLRFFEEILNDVIQDLYNYDYINL